VIVDGSQVPVVYASDAIDITRAFINEFNAKNPATASVTPRQRRNHSVDLSVFPVSAHAKREHGLTTS
jgi:hypothetical protein